MKLQLALDDITLEDALSLVRTVRDYIDIIEIGTPFVIEYGMEAVRVMKKEFPEKEILADLKIMEDVYKRQVFDNGGWGGYGVPNPGSRNGSKNALRDYSRVLEFNPITLEVVWKLTPKELAHAIPTDARCV